MLTQYKKFFQPFIAIIARPFLSWNPTNLTLLSLLAAMLFFLGIVTHIYVVSIVSIAGFVFDMMDGYVARSQKKVSKIGAFLDSTLDRASDFFIITSFGFAHLVAWELIVAALFTSYFISYMRTRAEATFGTQQVNQEGLMQRTERIVFILLAFFLFLFFPAFSLYHFSLLTLAFAVILVLNCFTILQRFLAIKTYA